MTRFEDTPAAEIDLDALPSGSVTFVKIWDLEEVPFTVLAATVDDSTYPKSKNTAAFITFFYEGDTEMGEEVCQFSTEQIAIKRQVQMWLDKGTEFPIEGVTVREYGENAYGTKKFCLASAIPEIETKEEEKPAPKSSMQISHRSMQVDRSEDTKRSLLTSKSIGRPSPKGR